MNTAIQYKIFLKGRDRTKDVQSYRPIGQKFEVTFNEGRTFSYNKSNVRLVIPDLNVGLKNDCFEYLTEVASEVGLKVEVKKDLFINILSNNYSKIEQNNNGILSSYLKGTFPKIFKNTSIEVEDVVYPFGFNESQKKAVNRALNNQLSIIEGPPGTGKTQTILNIIANIVMKGETVAVVSSNNSATQNVFDKLEKSGVEFIAASLGNRVNKKEFIEAQKARPDMSDWKLFSVEVQELTETLAEKQEKLEKKLKQKIELSSLRQELSSVEIEYEHFKRFSNQSILVERLNCRKYLKKADDALELWHFFENYKTKNKLIQYIEFIMEFITIGGGKRRFVRNLLEQHSRSSLIETFQDQFYIRKIEGFEKSINLLSSELEDFDYDSQMQESADISLKLFKAKLYERYQSKEEKSYEVEDLKDNTECFLESYPLILSTTYSLRSSLSNNMMYDYVIIDESSQVDICTGALALSCAKKVVVVGDLKQLPHVVDSRVRNITDSIFSKYNLPEAYRYSNNSLLSSLINLFPDTPRTLLREHYRCHPKIIEFCNKKFYDNQLIIMTEDRYDIEPLIVYKTVTGNHERNRMNQRQIDVIKEEVIPQQSLSTEDGSLGIISPYRNQTNKLQKAFLGMQVKADTVDKFQGQESKVVVLSTVDNEISEFADNDNRLNVAVSRAVDQLIVVVNDSDSLKGTNIGGLVDYIEYNNLSSIESKVHSVFDYLYGSYEQKRKEYLSKSKKVSEFDSENLMNLLIEKILKRDKFKGLGSSAHVPLRMIIRDMELLTSDEAKFVSNPLTHVDFLLFDSLSKKPKLAIEVDGVSFHKEGSKQAIRDQKKNDIMLKYGLPLLRFRTDGSSELKKLEEAVELIVGD